MKMNCNGSGNATTQERASWERHYHDKQALPQPKEKKKKPQQRQHVRFLLYCLAAFTAWFIISISFLVGGSHGRHGDVEQDKLSFLQPLTTRNNNYDYDEIMEHDLNLLPPSVGLKFDWNANTNNRNSHHHRLDDRHESNDSNDDDDDDENNLRMKHRRQTTMMGPNDTNDNHNTTTATITKTLSSSLNTTTNNYTLSNSTTLVVLSVCIPGERFSSEYIHASLYNKQSFCNKWGVECILSKERLAPDAASSAIITTPSPRDKKTKTKNLANTKQNKLLVYSPKWEKLYLLNRTLHTHPHADWLLWLDCDAAFTNLDINWRTHLHSYLPQDKKSKVLIASKDKAGINLGVFFIPNTPPAKQLIKLLWEERHMVERNKYYLKDQVALQRVLKARPQIQRYIYTDIPQRKINSV